MPACRAGPFSCQLASAKLEKKKASFKQRRVRPGAAVCGLCGGGCLGSKCYEHTTLPTYACRAGPFSCQLASAKLEGHGGTRVYRRRAISETDRM